MLADRRIKEIRVLPPGPESKPNSFKLRLDKEDDGNYLPLTKADLIVKLGHIKSLASFTVSETSLEQIFQ